jgi:hypothetical protein
MDAEGKAIDAKNDIMRGCQEPMLLIGIGSGEERMQHVTCEHCGILLEVSWPVNGSPEVRIEPKLR